ncbi:MAG: hypothetical protein ABSB76_07485 [Streptosporangiaceae bacterium]
MVPVAGAGNSPGPQWRYARQGRESRHDMMVTAPKAEQECSGPWRTLTLAGHVRN